MDVLAKKKASEIIEPLLKPFDAFLVDIELRGVRGSKVLEFFIDTDAGISTDMLALISRSISDELDTKELIHGRYHLVISSPGLDKPLRLLRQYKKNIGRTLKISLKTDQGLAHIEGILENVNEKELTIREKDSEPQTLSLVQIHEAVVVPKFRY